MVRTLLRELPFVADRGRWCGRVRLWVCVDVETSIREIAGNVSYVKGILVGGVMFIIAFALVLILMVRHPAPPLPPIPANAEVGVGFYFNSNWTNVPDWPALAAGIAAFAGGFYWTLRRSRNRAARRRTI